MKNPAKEKSILELYIIHEISFVSQSVLQRIKR